MRTVKIVIFDFDGVIFNSWSKTHKLIKFLAKFSNCTDEEIRKNWGQRADTLAQMLTKRFPWPINKLVLKIIFLIWRYIDKRNSDVRFFKETLKIIEEIRNKGYITGILTNRTTETLKKVLMGLPAPPEYYFDFIQTYEKVDEKDFNNFIFKNHFISRYPKPDQFAFINFCYKFLMLDIEKVNKKLDPRKFEIVYIGDTLTDLEFAINSNINFYGVLTGPLDSKEKWVIWSKGKMKEENVLSSIEELLIKLKIPQ